jgi:uncharacterized membrane protein YphA (DoxX/SURF4 family)
MKHYISLIFFLLRLACAVVFISAGVSKIGDPSAFFTVIQAFHILPYPVAFAAALVLPWLEILAGAALLTLNYSAAASLLLSGLTLGFLGFISIAKAMGTNLDCGCFGTWFKPGTYEQHMTLNLVLLGVLLVVFLRCASTQFALDKGTK